jgi:hypothetical protein
MEERGHLIALGLGMVCDLRNIWSRAAIILSWPFIMPAAEMFFSHTEARMKNQ